MRGTLLVVALAVVLLGTLVAWHEFAVGLQGYAPLPRDGELGTWALAVGTDGQTLTVGGPPDSGPLPVPLPPGSPVLAFDTLTPGPLGRLLGLQPLVKLSGVGVGGRAEGAEEKKEEKEEEETTEGNPAEFRQDAKGVLTPLHGGTDGCWQILDLTGVLGRLVARPDRVYLNLEAGDGGAGRIIVHSGVLALSRTPNPTAGP